MKSNSVSVTIRKIPLEAHQRLKVLAKARGHSVEAEIRQFIIQHTQAHEATGNLGDEMLALGRRLGGLELDVSQPKSTFRDLGLE